MRAIVLCVAALFSACGNNPAPPEHSAPTIAEDMAHLKKLEATNAVPLRLFRASGPHQDAVTMRCVVTLDADPLPGAGIKMKAVSWCVRLNDSDAAVSFPAYMRRSDTTEAADLYDHLKDGNSHLAIIRLATFPDSDLTPLILKVDRWDEWEALP